MRIVWSRPALNQLRAIEQHLHEHNPAAADGTMHRLATASLRLDTFPESGRPGREPGTREIVVIGTPYVVSYRVVLDVVQILAIVHGARRWRSEPRR